MWFVHAGNRVDATDREQPRFPEANVDRFERRLRRFLEEAQPSGVVSAAAAGADLLVLDVARDLGLRYEVVLPLPIEEFVARSVADRGPAWVRRFRRVVPDASRAIVVDLSAYDDWYLRGNDVILDHASDVANGEGVLAVTVRSAPDDGPESATDEFARRARGRGLTVIDLDPTSDASGRAFVVMPFGVKPDPSRPDVKIDCDATFRKLIVPLLEDADLDWTRADRATEAGMVHVGMFNELATADVVVADLTLENPNVLYELGIRHALRPRSTVMLHRNGGFSMFDLRPLREFRYDLVGAVITDDEALAAIKRIGPAIELAKAASTEVDSPFHALFELSPPTFSVRPRASTFTVGAFHELSGRLAALERHSRGRDATAITDEVIDGLIDDVRGLQIEERSKRALLFQLGVLLRQLGRYRRALDVLDALQLKTADSGYAESRKEQAMNHRRLGEAAQRNGGDPEPEWAAAARLLDDALTVEQLDPDAYGVAGGLAKRRADRALSAGRQSEAEVLLRDAARHYGDGIRAAPSDYYLLLNRATTLRVLGQHFDDHRALDEARLLLPVATYFATRAAGADPNDFYAAVSAGELCYTGYAIAKAKARGGTTAARRAERWYADAMGRGANADERRAVLDQLAFYGRLDGPSELLDRLRSLVGAG